MVLCSSCAMRLFFHWSLKTCQVPRQKVEMGIMYSHPVPLSGSLLREVEAVGEAERDTHRGGKRERDTYTQRDRETEREREYRAMLLI